MAEIASSFPWHSAQELLEPYPVPKASGSVRLQGLKDRVMSDVRQCDNGPVVRRRQHVVIHGAEPFRARRPFPDAMEMEQPDGPRRVRRKLPEHTQAVQDLLPVRLKDFTPQAAGWTRGLFQHQGADPFLGQGQTEHGPSAACAHNHDVRLLSHLADLPLTRVETPR